MGGGRRGRRGQLVVQIANIIVFVLVPIHHLQMEVVIVMAKIMRPQIALVGCAEVSIYGQKFDYCEWNIKLSHGLIALCNWMWQWYKAVPKYIFIYVRTYVILVYWG